mgnify:CR=1 FL=1
MIDWSVCKVEEFSLEVDAEEIQEVGQQQLFPIRVFYKDGALAFLKSVPIRSEFYLQLCQREDWKKKLMTILNHRVKEEIAGRIRAKQMRIGDKLEFMESGRNNIV